MTNANGEETELIYHSLFGPTQILYPDGTSKSSLEIDCLKSMKVE